MSKNIHASGAPRLVEEKKKQKNEHACQVISCEIGLVATFLNEARGVKIRDISKCSQQIGQFKGQAFLSCQRLAISDGEPNVLRAEMISKTVIVFLNFENSLS